MHACAVQGIHEWTIGLAHRNDSATDTPAYPSPSCFRRFRLGAPCRLICLELHRYSTFLSSTSLVVSFITRQEPCGNESTSEMKLPALVEPWVTKCLTAAIVTWTLTNISQVYAFSQIRDCGHLRWSVDCQSGRTNPLKGIRVSISSQDFGSLSRLDTNDSLRLASTWHGLHAIAMQLSPVAGGGGIEYLEAETFDLHCLQTLTGTLHYPNSRRQT